MCGQGDEVGQSGVSNGLLCCLEHRLNERPPLVHGSLEHSNEWWTAWAERRGRSNVILFFKYFTFTHTNIFNPPDAPNS